MNKKPKIKTEEEIQQMADLASDRTHEASHFKGMTYEEGIRDALDWVLGDYEGDLV